MATVNLGRIRQVWRGTWATGTAYVKDDVVLSGVNSYICVNAHTAGATFAGDSANWELMVQGTEIPSQTGQAGKALVTDGSSLSWDKAGLVLGSAYTSTTGITTQSNNYGWGGNFNSSGSTHMTINYTPKSATSTLFIYGSAPIALEGNARGYVALRHNGAICGWSCCNGYAGDNGGGAISAAVPSGSTASRAIDYRNIGGDGGFNLHCGYHQGGGNVLYPNVSSLHVIEVEA